MKTGYYWIRQTKNSGWEPATYSSLDDVWTVCGSNKYLQEKHIHLIGNELPVPTPFKDKTYYDGQS